MKNLLLKLKLVQDTVSSYFSSINFRRELFAPQKRFYLILIALNFLLLTAVLPGNSVNITKGVGDFVSPVTTQFEPLHPLAETKGNKEVFGFAPFWTFNKLSNIDFETLTTLAYFGVPVTVTGDLDRTDQGYITFKSKQATNLFKKAHASGTRVVLTLTQMNNWPIQALLDDPIAQENAINQAVTEVESRGVDGINVDFEYNGDPGPVYRKKFTTFVNNLTQEMHAVNPNSKVTVSVYAASVKDPKIYDIPELAKVSDGIFMMAYDFATVGADQAMPTAPLYGHKEGTYWYDVSTAVDDFLKVMPAEKLILGVPWYGYNYLVYEPGVKAETRPYYTWKGQPTSQSYDIAQDNIKPGMPNISDYKEGWDEAGQVGWKAYYRSDTGTWRMIFLEDPKSLGIKYDFVKDKNLAGVGIWALGFDHNKNELWEVLKNKFGKKLADVSILGRGIVDENN